MTDAYRFEPRKRARRRALQAIYQWQLTGQDPGQILRQFRDVQDMKGVDEAYFESLLRGVSERKDSLDEALSEFTDRPLEQVDMMERVVLRIGAYELLHCPELPYRVVLDQCVDLAHRFGSEGGHAFVNAVLDRAARSWRPDESSAPDPS
ncbi:MAG: transcription antitermination factor NusB [Gammaproteobacteria bacterium]|jgi:N utilization substance protein B|nr:transcription antitermination factor NusB [Gammaproteobacteria bacterium]